MYFLCKLYITLFWDLLSSVELTWPTRSWKFPQSPRPLFSSPDWSRKVPHSSELRTNNFIALSFGGVGPDWSTRRQYGLGYFLNFHAYFSRHMIGQEKFLKLSEPHKHNVITAEPFVLSLQPGIRKPEMASVNVSPPYMRKIKSSPLPIFDNPGTFESKSMQIGLSPALSLKIRDNYAKFYFPKVCTKRTPECALSPTGSPWQGHV